MAAAFVSETLTHAINELKAAYAQYQHDPEFIAEFKSELAHFVGRPSPVYHAARMSREMGGAQIFLKREDLNHTGAHKINNTIGQAMLAKRMGKPRIIAETGAGQHGVATATICARYGLGVRGVHGQRRRQAPKPQRLPHEAAGRDRGAGGVGQQNPERRLERSHARLGGQCGQHLLHHRHRGRPHPYPMMVRDFQSVIGEECLTQMPEMFKSLQMAEQQPDAVIACVGGGSNAMGIFYPYIEHENTRLIGVEAAGEGMDSGKHSCSLQLGSPGVLHGNRTYMLQERQRPDHRDAQRERGPGLPRRRPRACLPQRHRPRRVRGHHRQDEALEAFHYLCRTEGIIPALESSHAVAYAMKMAKTMRKDQSILVNLSGRGDKDIGTVADLSNADFFCRPSCQGQSVKGAEQPVNFVK
jgi:tryptophan synthase beta chain